MGAVAAGACEKGTDITLKTPGSDLIVNYIDESITLTGDTTLVYIGEMEH